MTDTEAKAQQLEMKCANDMGITSRTIRRDTFSTHEALCRAIEREEAAEARHAAEMRELKERFSEAIKADLRAYPGNPSEFLAPFILPAPDPLDAVAAYFKVDRAEVERLFAENGLAVGKIGEAGE